MVKNQNETLRKDKMRDYITGFSLALIAMGWGVMIGEIINDYKLETVAENTGTCGNCGNSTQVIIREKR